MSRCPFVAVVALAALVGSVACGSGSATLAPDSPIWIETSQLAVTVENRAGVPLENVSVAVTGSGLTFTRVVPRVENAQRIPLTLDEFTSPDGTHLNLRAHSPRTVRVTATGIAGRTFDVATSWQ
jgi:hypothetical protein